MPPTQSATRLASAFPLALAAYFIVQIVIRVTQQGALELDEAEQVYYAQQLKLGYGTQPPLYAWLQWLVFQVVGVGHFGLSLLKNSLLFLLYWSMYRTGRLLLGSVPGAAVAASLVLILPLGWEAQVDRTHSILATTVAAGALWTYFTIVRDPPNLPGRILFGALLGLGMLSKYNFALFALGLAGASLAVPEHRRAFWTVHAWPLVAVAALVLLPHAWWFIHETHAATAATLGKMGAGQATRAHAVARGLNQLLLSIASFITPLWIAFLFAWRHGARPAWDNPAARCLLWMLGLGLAGVALLVLSGQLANIKSRWLQPLLFALPLAACIFLAPRNARAWRRLLACACGFAVVMTALLAMRPTLQLALGRVARIAQPYAELHREIRQRFPGMAIITVQDANVGGNLLLHGDMAIVLQDAAPCRHKTDVLVLSAEQPWLDAARRRCGGKQVRETGRLLVHAADPRIPPLAFHYAVLRHGREGT